MSSQAACAICNKPIADTELLFTLQCDRHVAHGTHQTTLCPVVGCGVQGVSVVGVPMQTGLVASPHVSAAELQARARRLEQAAVRRSEPLVLKEPGFIESALGWTLKIASSIAQSGVPDDENSDPRVLLKAGVPLKTLVQKHGFDITELINDHRITIRDFFTNGYDMNDMCGAFSRMDRIEGMDVLWVLGMTDAYLTQCPALSQVETMKARLGFTPDHLVEKLGYRFVPGAWTIPQMIDAGLTMTRVKKEGLRTKQEWQQLAATARGNQDLLLFGVTQELVDDLLDEDAEPPSSILVATPILTPETAALATQASYRSVGAVPTPAITTLARNAPPAAKPAARSSFIPPPVAAVPMSPARQYELQQQQHQQQQQQQQQQQAVASRSRNVISAAPKLVDRPSLVFKVPTGRK